MERNYIFKTFLFSRNPTTPRGGLFLSLPLPKNLRENMMMAIGRLFNLLVFLRRRYDKPEKEQQKGGDLTATEECPSCRSPPDGDLPTIEDVKTVMQKLGFEISSREDEEDGECEKCRLVEEVCSFMEEKEASLDELQRAFLVFDRNGDGFIVAEELSRVLIELGFSEGRKIEDCKSMIRAYDEDGDGRICLEEFMGMLRSAA